MAKRERSYGVRDERRHANRTPPREPISRTHFDKQLPNLLLGIVKMGRGAKPSLPKRDDNIFRSEPLEHIFRMFDLDRNDSRALTLEFRRQHTDSPRLEFF